MTITLIGAIGKNRELGLGNKLLWHLPDDLKRFKEVTRGHAVIMGRKTYESIGRPLPERKNIIITRDAEYAAPGCEVVHSIEEALKTVSGDNEAFVIGGGEIYKLALPYANKMDLTLVDVEQRADAYFPEFNSEEWRVTSEEVHEADERHPCRFVFRVYEKKNGVTMHI